MTLCAFKNLSISVRKQKVETHLTHQVSFEIQKGEFFALVGESGSGKTITALCALGLLPDPGGFIKEGEFHFDGQNLLKLNEKAWTQYRGSKISMIFQDPMNTLNPLYKIGTQLREAWKIHNSNQAAGNQRITELFNKVGLMDLERILNSYPHQLSGGMLQRICIVMALLHRPLLLIADEPTTALDVTIQAQIMQLLEELRQESHSALLMITHNLALVSEYADQICVMQKGTIVENRPAKDFFQNPTHPYSQELLAATPTLELV